jgi:hypothetical protein
MIGRANGGCTVATALRSPRRHRRTWHRIVRFTAKAIGLERDLRDDQFLPAACS